MRNFNQFNGGDMTEYIQAVPILAKQDVTVNDINSFIKWYGLKIDVDELLKVIRG